MTESLTTNGEDADFRRLLEEIKSGQQKEEALLGNPVFERRIRFICHGLTENHADAEDLASELRLRVYQYFYTFEPQYDQPYGNFFAWVRRIAQNLAFSDFRRRRIDYIDVRSEELVDVFVTTNVELSVEVKEALQKFMELVAALPARDRRIVEIWAEGTLTADGFSLREISETLLAEGISCSHVTVGSVIRAVTRDFVNSIEVKESEGRPKDAVSRKPEQRSGPRRINFIKKKFRS
jgi:RNA polymerase sigma factor (sigma-70 family)